MRPADINRARYALQFVEEAQKRLEALKWDNLGAQEYTLRQSCQRQLTDVKSTIEDLIRIGGGKL